MRYVVISLAVAVVVGAGLAAWLYALAGTPAAASPSCVFGSRASCAAGLS